jgi:predicted methyltransferase
VTALCAACNTTSSRSAPPVSEGAAPDAHTSGAERGLPAVESYAHRLDDPARDTWQRPRDVIALLGCRPGDTVVDLGVGTGYFVPYLSEAVGADGKVVGLDVSEPTVDFVRTRAEEEGLTNVEVRTVPPDDPALASRSVDRILVVNTWHHISERVDYAKRLLVSLRRRGVLLIVDFTMESPVGPPVEHRLPIDAVSRELEEAGFAVEVLDEDLPNQYVVAGRPR